MKHKLKRNPLGVATSLAVIVSVLRLQVAQAQAQAEAPPPQPPPPPATSSPAPSLFQDGLSIGFGPWSGELELDYMNGMQSTTASDASNTTNTTSAFAEGLRIRKAFYVINPLFVHGNLGLDLRLNQDRSSGFDQGEPTFRPGRVIGYTFDAIVLEQKPYTGLLSANRHQVWTLQPSGGRVVGLIENRNASLQVRQDSMVNDWGYPWFEARLGFEQEKYKTTTSSFGLSQTTDAERRKLTFDASKGFETADLTGYYQIGDQHSANFAQSNYQFSAAGLVYSGDFGPTLNRRFDARLNYLTRNGVSPSKTISNSEGLHIDHDKNLNSDYRYDLTQQTFDGISTLVQHGRFKLTHQLYQNLTTTAALNGSRSTLPNGSITSYGGQLGQGYHHSLPGKGNFFANWAGGYELRNNDLSTSSISVTDEAHSAPAPLGAGAGFLLNHAFAVAASIVVTNVRGGARVPTIAGIDYDVIALNNQITIVPLAGSLRISQGDPLEISYVYQIDPHVKLATRSSEASVGISYGWISLRYGHSQSIQTPLNQASSLFLLSTRKNLAHLGLQGRLLAMDANADLDFENEQSTTSTSTQRRLGATLAREIQYNMRLTFGANASETRYTLPAPQTNSTRAARSSFNWVTEEGWTHIVSLDWSSAKGSALPPETLVQVIGQSSITYGLLSLKADLAVGRWVRSDRRATNRSLNMSAVRRF